MSMKVRDKMSTPVETINAKDKTVVDAAQLMTRKNIGSLIVMRDGTPMMITERDVVRALAEDNYGASVVDYSKDPLVTITEDAYLGDAAQMMLSNHIRRLVVVNNTGKISGIINIRDVTTAVHDSFLAIFEIS